MEDAPGQLIALKEEREKTVKALSDAFADDIIDVDEFDERMAKAHSTSDVQSLILLRRDISVPTSKGTTALAPTHSVELAEHRPNSRWMVTALGGKERTGRWRVPAKLRVVNLIGGTVLDFREAVFSPGISDVSIFAAMGGVEVIVPPYLSVECDGLGVMGGFESLEHWPAGDDPNRPHVRIRGVVVMGGVDLSVRYPGESASQAKKRAKRARKERMKALKAKSPKRLDS